MRNGALARGDDLEEIIRRIADYRANDKADPNYYACLTVTKALNEREVLKTQPEMDYSVSVGC